MPEITEKYIRIPIANQKKDARIRAISVSEKDGIKALYDAQNKIVVTFLFDREKWTLERARQWLKNHRK